MNEQEKRVPAALDADALLERVDALKKLLEQRGRQRLSEQEQEEYILLRRELRAVSYVNKRLPSFIHECRQVDEVWPVLREFSSYAERDRFVWEAFSPLVAHLEDGCRELQPFDGRLSQVDWEHVQEAWLKLQGRLADDPDGAITAARSLLESVCKHILDANGEVYDPDGSLKTLYRKTAESMALTPEDYPELLFKQVLGGCQSVVEGLAGLRNSLGDAHGRGRRGLRARPRHAELAANLAGTMATFLIATWNEKREIMAVEGEK